MKYFFIEMTDTFGGEANYSWVKRYKVKATTMRGAVNKIAQHCGAGWRKVMDTGDMQRFDSALGGVCFFIELFDVDSHCLTNFVEI